MSLVYKEVFEDGYPVECEWAMEADSADLHKMRDQLRAHVAALEENAKLAARVLELEALLTDLLSTKRYDANNGRGGEGKFVTMNIRAELVKRADAAIDAARSKP